MADYFYVYYVGDKDEEEPEGFPPIVVLMRDWLWGRTALARWRHGELEQVRDWIDAAQLVILDWPAQNPVPAKRAYIKIRERTEEVPILILKRGPGQNAFRDGVEQDDKRALGIHEREIGDSERLSESLAKLKVAPEPPSVEFANIHRHLEIRELINWVGGREADSEEERIRKGKGRLQVMLQVFFPDAARATIWPVGGGWSGTSLCQVFVENGECGLFFVKFFTDQKWFLNELAQHTNAENEWLGDCLVKLRLVDELPGRIESQLQAFPAASSPAVYPVCYESAADVTCPRRTLKSIYQDTGAGNDIESAFVRLLDILAQQPRAKPPTKELPGDYLDENTQGLPFELPATKRIKILAACQDLAVYGQVLSDDWRQRCQAIDFLLCARLPDWLEQPIPVVKGCIHRDPNSRNCLVNPEDFSDMKLIDAGGFDCDGRLVFDLALIETDLKLCLMATERDAGGLLDLESAYLPTWMAAESHSLSVDGTPSSIAFDTDAACITGNPAVARAYRIIAMVRERAKELSGDWDPEGRHYFAALLYWTLNSLRFDTIWPTKKLLAIYSASEILRRF